MDFSTIDSWTVVVSESQPSSIEKLGNLIDFGNPPAFFDFADRQWQRRGEGDASGWDLLMDGQFILRAVGHPGVLSLKQALTLMGFALQVDTLFATKLLRRLPVSVRPGTMQLTRMPSAAHSSLRPWVMFTIAALVAA